MALRSSIRAIRYSSSSNVPYRYFTCLFLNKISLKYSSYRYCLAFQNNNSTPLYAILQNNALLDSALSVIYSKSINTGCDEMMFQRGSKLAFPTSYGFAVFYVKKLDRLH